MPPPGHSTGRTGHVGSETYDLTAAEIEGAERERLRAQQLEHAPYFAGFQERVGRRIPVSRWCVRPG